MKSGYVSVFDRAKDGASVGDLVGAAATMAWRRLKTCPLCGGRDDFSYRVNAFHCFKCGERGSVVDLAAMLWGLPVFDAACKLIGADLEREREAYAAAHGGERPRGERRVKPVVVAQRPAGEDNAAEVVARVRARMKRADGTIAERYLVSRGIDARFARCVHFCPDAPYDVSALWGRGRTLPAMVCVVESGGAPTGGMHLTYLRADGAGKADTLRDKEPAKKMWGPQSHAGAGPGHKPGGIVLQRPRDDVAVLCVAEGVENALSLAQLVGDGAGAFAAGSLDRLQGGMAKTSWGAIDWRKPSPDPNAPAATIAHRGPVLIALDSDMSPLVINRGTKWERTISPERRAQVCGVLAEFWWKRQGASDVRCVTPPAGTDVNDFLKGQIAA